MRLPEFDPSWNRQCLACRNVMQEVQGGVRILRCDKAVVSGGGWMGRKSKPLYRRYCIDVIDEECRLGQWYESANNGR